ncbi:MAG: protein kinase [Pirellulaceae bacterium]
MIVRVRAQDRQRFNESVQRFRDRWIAEYSGALTINHFAKELPDDSLRLALLMEYVAIDLVTRLSRGDRVSLDDYLKLIDELPARDNLPARLLATEYLQRQKTPYPLSLIEYLESYPIQAAEVRRIVQSQSQGSERDRGTMVWPQSDAASESQAELRPIDLASLSDSDTDNRRTMRQSWSSDKTDRFVNLEGGYRMLRKIGQGNYGEVWLSEAPGGVEVAMKVVHIPSGQSVKRMEMRSLDLMKRLRHPFLLQVQAFWVHDDQILIAMELADESLRDRVRKHADDVLLRDELLRHMQEAAEGIDYLHRQKVVHRDIKPENMLLLKGHIKVADFGLARFMDESGLNAAATQVAGSPMYMAPEVWSGKPVAASDQYSLAVSYVELKRGRAPFSTSSMVAIMQEHLYGEPELSDLSAAEQAVLRTALAKRPEDRFATCHEMVQALQQATLATTSAIEPEPKSARRSVLVLGGFALLALAAFGSVAYLYDFSGVRKQSDPPEINLRDNVAVAYGDQVSFAVTGIDESDAAESAVFEGKTEGLQLTFNPGLSELTVAAELNAPLGSQAVSVVFSTPRGIAEKTLQIEVIDSKRLGIPASAQPVGSERIEVEGRILYKLIDVALPSAPEDRIRFVLVPRNATSDPSTFYMMQQEVNNRWFTAFAQANPASLSDDSQWRKGALAGTELLGVDGAAVEFPVVFVTAEEAHAFATWIGGLLPTIEQWDKAAGSKEPDRRAGPYVNDGKQICVARFDVGPVACGTSADDLSPFGVRDMAGSVTELTRNILESTNLGAEKLTVPLVDHVPTDRVILRGQSYHDPEPWMFDDSLSPSLPYSGSKT